MACIGGVEVRVGGGWLVLAILIVTLFGPQIARDVPALGFRAYLVALGYALLLLVSVMAHEAAHAVAARACGYRVHRIVADLLGGHTTFDAVRATAPRHALVAVVGPLANALLGVLAWQLLPYLRGQIPGMLLGAAVWSNGFVAVFNLLPALPLDGGALLEAAIWLVTGRRDLGLRVAGWSGRLLALGVVGYVVFGPILLGRPPGLITLAWAALIGLFLWSGGSHAIASGRARGHLARNRLTDVLTPVVTVPRGSRLGEVAAATPTGPAPAAVDESGGHVTGQAAGRPANPGWRVLAVVVDAGSPIGVLDPEAVAVALAQDGPLADSEPCLRLMPPAWVFDVSAQEADLGNCVEEMIRRRVPMLLLREPGGAPWGALDGAIVARLAEQGSRGAADRAGS